MDNHFYTKEILEKKFETKADIAEYLTELRKEDFEMGYSIDFDRDELYISQWEEGVCTQYHYRIILDRGWFYHFKLLKVIQADDRIRALESKLCSGLLFSFLKNFSII